MVNLVTVEVAVSNQYSIGWSNQLIQSKLVQLIESFDQINLNQGMISN